MKIIVGLTNFVACCNNNMLKIVKNLTAPHFLRANDAVMKFLKEDYLYKIFQNGLHQLYSHCNSKACKGM